MTHLDNHLWNLRGCPQCRLEAAQASALFALVLALLMLAMVM